MTKNELLDNIVYFLFEEFDCLVDHVKSDLNIHIDEECSCLYDEVEEKFISVSFENVIEKTRDRIVNVIESYKK